jgi:hypothetical protein
MRFAALATIACAGCVATATPRFPDDVASALASHAMRRLDTDELILYYPAGREDLAVRTARKMTTCLRAARGHAQLTGRGTHDRPRVVMPELPFNNAFVLPRVIGYEDISVVPTENTLDFATAFGIPPDPGHIGCHEITHYVQVQQVSGFWAVLDLVLGDVLSPQVGLDAWLWEGVATYYEQQGGAGRLRWPVWRGVFAAAYAGRGLDGGDLSELNRRATAGHHYLVGSHFVEWLVDTYGEERLWGVIKDQGKSVAFLLDVNGRFKHSYGKSLSRLIGEFSRWVARMPRRPVPAGETQLRAVGDDARYARGVDGSEATVSGASDVPTHLEVRGPDGAVRTSVNLVDLIVPRKLVIASPLLVSGMAFAADGTLYLTVLDLGTTYQTTRLLRVRPGGGVDVIRTGLGPGLGVTADGARYWVAAVDGDAWGLDVIDLATRARTVAIAPAPGRFVLRASPSPRGDRALVSEWDGHRFDVALYEIPASGPWRRDRVLAGEPGEPAYDATWIDDDRVLYLAPVDGRFQAWVHELTSGTRTAITDAPYTAFEPRAAGGTLRFLDREGWQWQLAEVAIPAPVPAAPVPADAPITIEAPGVTAGGGLAEADITVRRDRGYSVFDGLFVPHLHTIALAAGSDGTAMFGLGLAGGDHLGQQRWAVTGLVDPNAAPARFGWSAGYSNAMLAPWIFSATAQHLRWHHGIDDDPEVTGFERYADRAALDVVATVGRTLRGTTAIALSGIYSRDDFTDLTPETVRLGGVGLSFGHDNVEATRHGGVRRRLAVQLDVAHYPRRGRGLSSLVTDLTDTREEVVVTAPIPWTRRHALTLGLRHRALLWRDWGGRFHPLLVGGGPFAALLQRPASLPPLPDEGLLPERLRFVEPLRGFEDLELPASGVAIAELSWRYPLIIDRGMATSLYYFPAILLRELDLELFGTAARRMASEGSADHLATGAAITLSIYFWRAPILLRYQVARRFTDDDAVTHQIGIALGL